MFRQSLFRKTVWVFAAMLGLVVSGCGGGGGGTTPAGSPSLVQSGTFLDDAIQGLEYSTATQSGITDVDGTFQYMEGEMIRFSMGGIDLGQAPARSFMTPIDLVPGAEDESDPMVTNMIRFMQTLDTDANPDNGITLSMPMMNELRGRNIRFDMDPDEFEQDADVTMFMDTIAAMDRNFEGRTMIPVDQARSHMRGTLARMMGQSIGMGSRNR